MAEMTGRDYYIKTGYYELPEAVIKEMRRVFDTGVYNSGLWVRYKEVENLAGIMAYQYTHRPVATNADRIRGMTDEELAEWIISQTEDDTPHWLDWLQSPVEVDE